MILRRPSLRRTRPLTACHKRSHRKICYDHRFPKRLSHVNLDIHLGLCYYITNICSKTTGGYYGLKLTKTQSSVITKVQLFAKTGSTGGILKHIVSSFLLDISSSCVIHLFWHNFFSNSISAFKKVLVLIDELITGRN